MAPASSPAIGLIAEGWQADGLARLLAQIHPSLRMYLGVKAVSPAVGNLQLLIWNLAEEIEPAQLQAELRHWRQRLGATPLLLVLPSRRKYSQKLLLQLPAEGLLEAPSSETLLRAVDVLLTGGRVFVLAEVTAKAESGPKGLGAWLLRSGLEQIDAEAVTLQRWLSSQPRQGLYPWAVAGRLRELAMARQVLLLIWGAEAQQTKSGVNGTSQSPQPQTGPVEIVLANRGGLAVLKSLEERLALACAGLGESTAGQLLALEALSPERRSALFEALLAEFRELVRRLQLSLQGQTAASDQQNLWANQQPLLRERALQSLVGAYTQLPREGELLPLGQALVRGAQLQQEDPELPDLLPSLRALLEGRPLLVDGQLLAPDEPRALLHLQLLLSNWVVRNAELIARQLLEACSGWPELRRTMLVPSLLPTRELERLRNQINSRERWQTLFERPVAIYESRRLFYGMEQGLIQPTTVMEPRDGELRQLSWWQQAITLMLEARDALAPQVLLVLNRLGTLMVLLLTRVLGRAIGLIGRGILQGLGRGLQNAPISNERP